jgi:hypothetical protein
MNTLEKPLQQKQKQKSLLGRKITDAIKSVKVIPDFIYKFKQGKCYVFKDAPFNSLHTEKNTIFVIDDIKECRHETRYVVNGLVLAAPDENTDYTIVGDIVNISNSAIRIKPYVFPKEMHCIWKLHIDLGYTDFDVTGNIVRFDSDCLVFKFTKKNPEMSNYLKQFNINKRTTKP